MNQIVNIAITLELERMRLLAIEKKIARNKELIQKLIKQK
jgi:hypothetical protein